MVVLVEIQMPGNVGTTLLIVFAVTTSLVVAFMLVAMLNATWTMVAILRYDCVTREVPFEEFWRKRCQSDFIFTLRVFSYGAPLFMCVLAELGWVLYWNHEGAWLIASPLVTAVALCSMIFWFSHTDRKWSDFLMNPEVKLFHPPT